MPSGAIRTDKTHDALHARSIRPAREREVSERRFGLPTASALVVGSLIGTGVFALPSALAGYGPISLVALVLVTIGSIALALTFGALSGRTPASGAAAVVAGSSGTTITPDAVPAVRSGSS